MKQAALLSLTDPYIKRDGGTLRTRAMIGALEKCGFDVECVYPTGDASRRNEGRPAMGRLASSRQAASAAKRHFLPLPTELGQRSTALGTEVRRLEPSLTVTSVLSQAQFVDPRNSVFWLDFMDIWSEFGRREADRRTGLSKMASRTQSRWLRARENKYCNAAHVVTAAGWSDWKTLVAHGHRDAVWLPNPIADDSFETVPRASGEPNVAGLIGNFEYWPNREAYRTVIDSWLPRLVDSGWRVVVAGSGSDALEQRPGVIALGHVDNLNDYYGQIDVTLAPIDLGGGMKVKVLESFSRGVPVVGTAFAFDGFPEEVRALGITVDLAEPDLTGLQDLIRVDPTSPVLQQFTTSAFNAKVHRILADVT
ncbi:glycosyltransferase [Rhodococcoides trifolii]|nr:glycosyltransferase [Rhodococcus trifolii]